MMHVEPWLEVCRRRLNFGEFLRVAAEWLAGWLCVFGSLVLIVKLLAPGLWPNTSGELWLLPYVLWMTATSLPVLLLAWRKSRAQSRTLSESAILLDRKLQTGGLLLALAESPNAGWERRLSADRQLWKRALPRIRPLRFFRLIILPLAFALGMYFVPVRETQSQASPQRTTGIAAVEELPRLLEDLKNADALLPEEEKYLREEIDKLVEESRNSPPTQQRWERIDTIRTRLRNRLDERTRIVQNARQAAKRLANDKKNGQELTTEQKRTLEADVARALQNLPSFRRAPNAKSKLARKSEKPARKSEKTETKTAGSAKSVAATTSAKTPLKTSKTGRSPSQKTQSAKTTARKTGASSPPAKTSRKTTSPVKTAKTSKTVKKSNTRKTQPSAKTDGGSKTRPATKTQRIGKSPAGKSAKTGSGKTGSVKTGAGPRKSQRQKTAPSSKTPSPKTAVKPKTASKSNPAKTRSPKKTGGTTVTKSMLQKLASKIPKNLPDLSPQMIEQLAKMLRAGEFRLPDDPALREELLKQAQKLLEREGHKLEELQRRYGRQIENALRNLPRDAFPPNGPERNPAGGPKTGRHGTEPSPGREPQPNVAKSPKVHRPRVGFRDVVLPPGFLDTKKDEVTGITGRAPRTTKAKTSGNAAESLAGSDPGGETYKRRHRPRHRALVKRYFQSKKK